MDVSHLLDGLNPAQREAVSAAPGHYLVLAGAGSGKTRVLTHRIAWLHKVEGVPMHGILAVTFTNKAAGEMRARIAAQMGGEPRGMWIGTFHGIAHRLLRLHWQDAKLPESFQVLDSDDQLRLVKRVVKQLEIDDGRFPPRQIVWWINAQKDEGRRPQHIQPEGDEFNGVMLRAYTEYQLRCERSGLVDFAELLLRAHEVLRDTPALLAHYRHRFGQLLVDEFQDTNAIQYGFVRLLAGKTGHVFVVGDDDQAIYGWRGAKVENVQRFLRDYPGAVTLKLEQNYRSTANILNAANAVIAHNDDRFGKQLWTEASEGEFIDLYVAEDEIDEARYAIKRIAQWVRDGGSYGDAAILYRSNAQSRAFEEALLAAQIAYRVYGGMRFFERAEIKEAMAYLRLVSNREDDVAFERAINTPTRGVGGRTLDEVRSVARMQASSLWAATALLVRGNGLAGRARNALAAFMMLIDGLSAETADMPLPEKIDHVLARSGLRAHYENESNDHLDSRTDNLGELVSVASRFSHSNDEQSAEMSELVAFLSYASLEAGEGQSQSGAEGVQLMTMHSAKGLEFPLVFLAGMEEGLFPNAKSAEESERMAEERRLAYVGITRTCQQLVISRAEKRLIYGNTNRYYPSRFLREIPKPLLREIRPKLEVAQGGYSMRGAVRAVIELPAIRLGANVRHPSFGTGLVTDVEGSGNHARIQVNFDDAGSKWLVLAYANLLNNEAKR
jgi:DNA helicase-2/ATP-dependent DNA helicase PcrA